MSVNLRVGKKGGVNSAAHLFGNVEKKKKRKC